MLRDARAAQGEGSDLSVTVLNMDLDEPRATDGTCDGGEQQLGRSTLIGQVFIPADALRAFLLQHHTHDVTQAICFPPLTLGVVHL